MNVSRQSLNRMILHSNLSASSSKLATPIAISLRNLFYIAIITFDSWLSCIHRRNSTSNFTKEMHQTHTPHPSFPNRLNRTDSVAQRENILFWIWYFYFTLLYIFVSLDNILLKSNFATSSQLIIWQNAAKKQSINTVIAIQSHSIIHVRI